MPHNILHAIPNINASSLISKSRKRLIMNYKRITVAMFRIIQTKFPIHLLANIFNLYWEKLVHILK